MFGTLTDVLPRSAGRFGDKAALVVGDHRLSYRELDRMTSRVANALAARGIGAGDRVTLYSPNCWEWAVAFYAIGKLGAVVNPINVMLTPEEVTFVVQDCGAKAVIASAEKGEALLDIQRKTGLSDVILFGSQVPAGALAFADMLRDGRDAFSPAVVADTELALICYTSGTTGHPKGAMLSHRNYMGTMAMTALAHRRGPEDTCVTALPCAHVYGSVVMTGAIRYGGTFVLLPRFTEVDVLRAIQTHRATIYDGVPTSFMMLLAHADFAKYDLSSLARCSVGGQVMPVAKSQEWEARVGSPLLELWGMTELSGPGTCNLWYGDNRHGTVGVCLPYNECRIADQADASRALPAGEVGELMFRGAFVMQGYFGNEASTRETIEPDGWLHTGDLAKMDVEGHVSIVDRKKDMILTGGYNIYPAEIERVLGEHPAVAMSGVGAIPDELRGELARAYVVLKPGAAATEDDIVQFCRRKLAVYKVPRSVKFVADLPKTSTGKIMRRQLRTLDA
jgi:long-chain acyl-CoA synthetase